MSVKILRFGNIVAVLLCIGACCGIARLVGGQPADPTLPSVSELRDRLEKISRDRVLQKAVDDVPWAEDLRPDLAESDSRKATIALISESDRLACVWTIRSVDQPDARSVRACVDGKGTQWVRLPPGNYEISIRAGIAGQNAANLRPVKARVRAGLGYISTFAKQFEKNLLKQWAEEKRENSKPPEEPAPVPAPARRGSKAK